MLSYKKAGETQMFIKKIWPDVKMNFVVYFELQQLWCLKKLCDAKLISFSLKHYFNCIYYIKTQIASCPHMHRLVILLYQLKTKYWVEWTLPWSLSRQTRSNLTVQKHSIDPSCFISFHVVLLIFLHCCFADLSWLITDGKLPENFPVIYMELHSDR